MLTTIANLSVTVAVLALATLGGATQDEQSWDVSRHQVVAKAGTVMPVMCHCHCQKTCELLRLWLILAYAHWQKLQWNNLQKRPQIAQSGRVSVLALATLEETTQTELILICVTSPKVAKVSTISTNPVVVENIVAKICQCKYCLIRKHWSAWQVDTPLAQSVLNFSDCLAREY